MSDVKPEMLTRTSATLVVVLIGPSFAAATAQERAVCVEPVAHALPPSVDFELEGCSCSFSSSRQGRSQALIAWPMDHETQAFINVCGLVQKLHLIKTSVVKGGKHNGVGDLHTWQFTGSTLNATVSGKQLSPECAGSTECEGFSVAGTLAVSASGREVSVPVEGACGC